MPGCVFESNASLFGCLSVLLMLQLLLLRTLTIILRLISLDVAVMM